MPLVSIIVPNFNHERYLKQRLDSIFNQTFQDFEVVLLDDCSTDSSKDILELYRNHPKVSRIIYNDTNGGTSYKQWIKGVENANCQLIWIAESDDWCDYHFLECCVDHFKKEDVDVVISKLKFVFNDEDQPKPVITSKFEIFNGINFIRERLLGSCGIPNASMVVFRKSKFLQSYDSEWHKFKQAGDWKLWMNLINNSQIVELNDVLSYFRIHGDNFTLKSRKSGLDFLEGLDVFVYGKTLCNNEFDTKVVYNEWSKWFTIFLNYFSKGITIKVLKKFYLTDKNLFFNVIYWFIIKKIKRIFEKISLMFKQRKKI